MLVGPFACVKQGTTEPQPCMVRVMASSGVFTTSFGLMSAGRHMRSQAESASDTARIRRTMAGDINLGGAAIIINGRGALGQAPSLDARDIVC